MKKQTVISIILILSALAAGTSVSAQSALQGDASASIEVHSGGGLGTGISNMVRTILGEDNQTAKYGAPVPVAPQAATMMMQVHTDSDISAPVPEARSMMLMSATEANPAPLTDDELHIYTSELLRSESMIQSIDTSDTHVRMTYAVPAKVFGFVRVVLRVTVGAYVSGETEVLYPWYSFVTARALSDLDATMQNRLTPLISSEPFTPDQQKMLIDEMYAELAARFGSSTQSGT